MTGEAPTHPRHHRRRSGGGRAGGRVFGRAGGLTGGRAHRDTDTDEASAAATAVRAAALLRGGVVPSRVLALAAAGAPEVSDAAAIASRVAAGTPIPEALAACRDPEWRVLAAAWHLAEQSGAPLAPALERIGSALRSLEQLRQRRAVLLAGPRATVRLVAALPPLALLLGALLGFDPLPVLASAAGLLLLIVGAALLCAGVAWGNSMNRRVEQQDGVAGVELELLWIVLGGGAPADDARRRVVDAVDEYGVEWVAFDRFLREGLLAQTVAAARSTGVPLRPLLLEEADAARLRAQGELERAAERLGVRVLLPLGMCVLPSFIVLGVLPVLIAMLGGG